MAKNKIILFMFVFFIVSPWLIESVRVVGFGRGVGVGFGRGVGLGWGGGGWRGGLGWRGWYPGRFAWGGTTYPFYWRLYSPYYSCLNGYCPWVY